MHYLNGQGNTAYEQQGWESSFSLDERRPLRLHSQQGITKKTDPNSLQGCMERQWEVVVIYWNKEGSDWIWEQNLTWIKLSTDKHCSECLWNYILRILPKLAGQSPEQPSFNLMYPFWGDSLLKDKYCSLPKLLRFSVALLEVFLLTIKSRRIWKYWIEFQSPVQT